jgi:hypothetical protein
MPSPKNDKKPPLFFSKRRFFVLDAEQNAFSLKLKRFFISNKFQHTKA